MADLGMGLTALGVALGGKDIIVKLLGPTADLLGEQFANFTQRRINNVQAILRAAADRLGDRIDEPGSVPPRVLLDVFVEGSFCEDDLVREYFGGLVAASRSDRPRDDRATTYLSYIKRMSSYQVRTHYIIYTAVRQTFVGESLRISIRPEADRMGVFFPWKQWRELMDCSTNEDPSVITAHSIAGLATEGLIGQYAFGREHHAILGHGVVATPSPLGSELYMWAHGYSLQLPDAILDPNLSFPQVMDFPVPIEAVRRTARQGGVPTT